MDLVDLIGTQVTPEIRNDVRAQVTHDAGTEVRTAGEHNMELQVLDMVKEQIELHIENCQGVIRSNLDSMQPTVSELMQES